MTGFLEIVGDQLADYYLYIKFVHMVFAAIWAWSTAVGYTNYLVPLFRDWQRSPDDAEKARARNWAMERFDEGAILEHIAFPALIITGPMLMLDHRSNANAGWRVDARQRLVRNEACARCPAVFAD